MQKLKAFTLFLHERFGLVSSPIMISLFVLTHFHLVRGFNLVSEDWLEFALIDLGTIIFFIKLRCYDEIKDYELDCKINPTRPLPRGLLSVNDTKIAFSVCITLELILFSYLGKWALVAMAVVIGYSLLMYNEFFIGKYIRPHLTTYATTHTVVTFFLSLSIFSAFTEFPFTQLQGWMYQFSLMSWLLFNIFELGRKMYQPEEERDQVESYTKVWSKPGAILLVLGHAGLVFYFAQAIPALSSGIFPKVIFIPLALLMIISGVFAVKDDLWAGKIYRNYSSLFIFLNYLTILGFTLLQGTR